MTGLAASAATIVMIGADKGGRLALPNARIMLHQPSQGARGTASDIAITAKEILRLRKKANELFAEETGHSIEKIEKDMHRDFWMTADGGRGVRPRGQDRQVRVRPPELTSGSVIFTAFRDPSRRPFAGARAGCLLAARTRAQTVRCGRWREMR